jgi:exonuclease SbcC
MINRSAVERKLRERFNNLAAIKPNVFVASEKFEGREFAIRYFDLSDDLQATADGLKTFQEELIAPHFYSTNQPSDLRWNQYLYFVTSEGTAASEAFLQAKDKIESNQDYARKSVVREGEIDAVLRKPDPSIVSWLPTDLEVVWRNTLEQRNLQFVLDDQLTITAVVEQIEKGQSTPHRKAAALPDLLPVELEASKKSITNLKIKQFRKHPTKRNFDFGLVNLITGPNGVGKTSLLEAIEFVYCGRNLRTTEAPLEGTSVIAKLRETDPELVTSLDTPTNQLKARHAAWYSKTDGLRTSIEKSFGRYSFLNTDAAFRLSTDKDGFGDIEGEITRLMLGAEADRLTSRVKKVRERLGDIYKEKAQTIDNLSNNLGTYASRMSELQSLPKLSDSNFDSFLTSLARCGWKSPPKHKHSIASIGSELQQTITACGVVIKTLAQVSNTSSTNFVELRNKFSSNLDIVVDAADKQSLLSQKTESARRLVERLAIREAALKTLRSYVESEFDERATELEFLQQRAGAIRLRLVSSSGVESQLSGHVNASNPIESEIGTANDAVVGLQTELSKVNDEIKRIESSIARIESTLQQMVAATRTILTHSPDKDSCPVCQTHVGFSQLLKHLDALSESPASVELAMAIEKRETLKSEIASRTKDARLLSDIRSVHLITASETVLGVFRRVEVDRLLLTESEVRIQALTTYLSKLTEQGLSRAAMVAACNEARFDKLPPQHELIAALSTVQGELESARTDLERAVTESSAYDDEWSELALKLQLPTDSPFIPIIDQLRNNVAALEEGIQAQQTLSGLLLEAPNNLLHEVAALEQAHAQLELLFMSIARESVGDESIKELAAQVLNVDQAREKVHRERERIDSALKVLDDLLSNESAQQIASDLIARSAKSINEIFSAIHSPNEFFVREAAEGIEIVRARDDEAVDLTSMSTGQRSAFALSLFLSLNQYARNAPEILIFDDPIAHVDDLNILSFLDHLRDIAIQGKRQIFFSTADAKVSSLFRQKFRFLGEEKFKEHALKRT